MVIAADFKLVGATGRGEVSDIVSSGWQERVVTRLSKFNYRVSGHQIGNSFEMTVALKPDTLPIWLVEKGKDGLYIAATTNLKTSYWGANPVEVRMVNPIIVGDRDSKH